MSPALAYRMTTLNLKPRRSPRLAAKPAVRYFPQRRRRFPSFTPKQLSFLRKFLPRLRILNQFRDHVGERDVLEDIVEEYSERWARPSMRWVDHTVSIAASAFATSPTRRFRSCAAG